MYAAFKRIIARMGVPQTLNADHEFQSSQFKRWATTKDVKLWLSYPDQATGVHNSVIEVANRWFGERIARQRRQGRVNWDQDVRSLLKQANASFNTTIKARPVDVWEGRALNNQTITIPKARFGPGDTVRLLLQRSTFQKGTAQQYTNERYTIVKRDPEYPNRWLLEDMATKALLPRGYLEQAMVGA